MSLTRKKVTLPVVTTPDRQETTGLNRDEYLYLQEECYQQASEQHSNEPIGFFTLLVYPNNGASYLANFPLDRESVAEIINVLEDYHQNLPPLPQK